MQSSQTDFSTNAVRMTREIARAADTASTTMVHRPKRRHSLTGTPSTVRLDGGALATAAPMHINRELVKQASQMQCLQQLHAVRARLWQVPRIQRAQSMTGRLQCLPMLLTIGQVTFAGVCYMLSLTAPAAAHVNVHGSL